MPFPSSTPTFSYTALSNPYSQTSSTSFEENLKVLIRSRGVPQLNTIQHLQSQQQEQLQHQKKQHHSQQQNQQFEWTLELARGLSTRVINLFETAVTTKNNNEDELPPSIPAVLYLLTDSMQKWQDSILYAVLVHQVPKKLMGKNNDDKETSTNATSSSLLDLLCLLVLANQNNQNIQFSALVGIATAWKCLERLHLYTVLDPSSLGRTTRADVAPWWMNNDYIDSKNGLSSLALITCSKLCSSNESSSSIPSHLQHQIDLACVNVLCCLLRYNIAGWLLDVSDQQMKILCDKLVAQAQTLANGNQPFSTVDPSSLLVIPNGISSIALLCLTEWRHSVDISSYTRAVCKAELIETVVKFSFQSPSASPHHGSSWIDDAKIVSNHKVFGQDLVYCWYLCGGEAWSGVVANTEQYWRSFLADFCRSLIEHSHEQPTLTDDDFHGALLWCVMNRMTMRGVVFSAICNHIQLSDSTESPCKRFIRSLLRYSNHPKQTIGIVATSLLQNLLSDRRSMTTHDELSRMIWSALTVETKLQCTRMVVSTASVADSGQPLLLSQLNLLEVILTTETGCQAILQKIGAGGIEKLIHMVSPSQIRIDFADTLEIDPDETLDLETPPVNNLSRLDEKSICFEKEEEKDPKGFDSTVRIAAATILARLGTINIAMCGGDINNHDNNAAQHDDDLKILQTRACKAVHEYFGSGMNVRGYYSQQLSFELTKRKLRLQQILTSPENEDFIATMLYNEQLQVQNIIDEQKSIITSTKKDLEAAHQREIQLTKQNEYCMKQLKSQSLIFQREKAREVKNTMEDSRQLLAAHVAERKNAEAMVVAITKKAEQTEASLKDYEMQVRSYKESESLLQSEIKQLKSRQEELQQQIEQSRQNERDLTSKVSQVSDMLQSKTVQFDSLQHNYHKLKDNLKTKEDDLAELNESTVKMGDNLEDLFGDMVSLSKAYEMKEKEMIEATDAADKSIKDLNDKLAVEQRRSQELKEREERLRTENDALVKKLARYKERILAERKEREEERVSRSRSSVSYINQLHNTTISSKSNSGRDRSGTSSNRDRSANGSIRDRSTRRDKENNDSYVVSNSYRNKYR